MTNTEALTDYLNKRKTSETITPVWLHIKQELNPDGQIKNVKRVGQCLNRYMHSMGYNKFKLVV